MAEILSTADGRDVYSYIISCALRDGTTIQAQVPGAADTAPPDTNYTCSNGVCTFLGSLGLADYWVNRRLDPQGQRWITACLLARVNANNLAEAISLRGLAPQLSPTGEEITLYTVQEGAFYGNVFADGDDIDWNACRGADASTAWARRATARSRIPCTPALPCAASKTQASAPTIRPNRRVPMRAARPTKAFSATATPPRATGGGRVCGRFARSSRHTLESDGIQDRSAAG